MVLKYWRKPKGLRSASASGNGIDGEPAPPCTHAHARAREIIKEFRLRVPLVDPGTAATANARTAQQAAAVRHIACRFARNAWRHGRGSLDGNGVVPLSWISHCLADLTVLADIVTRLLAGPVSCRAGWSPRRPFFSSLPLPEEAMLRHALLWSPNRPRGEISRARVPQGLSVRGRSRSMLSTATQRERNDQRWESMSVAVASPRNQHPSAAILTGHRVRG